MSSSRTDQELFWAGQFGDDYTNRTAGETAVAHNIALFARALRQAPGVRSVLEFGANVGANLRAIQHLIPDVRCSALEINPLAAAELRKLPFVTTHEISILDFHPKETWDLVLTKGLLIHLAPASLERVYDLIYQSTRAYICLAEYYNPSPVEVPYRGHSAVLFKRDFAGELLDRFSELRLLDYGFVYHRDRLFPQDDLTWFLLEKTR
jgi:spore coat polysaccharide biosynthesis protein SpsF